MNAQALLQKTLKQALRTSRYYGKLGRAFFTSARFEDFLDLLLHHKNERQKRPRRSTRAQREKRIRSKLKRVVILYRREILSSTFFIFRPRLSTAFALAVSALGYFEFFKPENLSDL